MRVMVFAKMVEGVDVSQPPTPEALEAFAAMDKFTEELVAAGVFVAAAGLKNDAHAKRIVGENGDYVVTDGPFTETKELIAGFSIWQVKDMDDALAWAKRAPVMPGKSVMEFLPFYEAEDLADYITPEELASAREGTGRDGERGKLGVA